MGNRFLDMDQDKVNRVVSEEARVAQTRLMLALFKRIRKRLGITGELTAEEVADLFKRITSPIAEVEGEVGE